ncbi:MAG TPA: phospholipase D-like domain-containing protein, partial [Longimicrobiales bacterium]|nr:phospholipase D-like domain-containing protein [Longimicrobiales bacterium]
SKLEARRARTLPVPPPMILATVILAALLAFVLVVLFTFFTRGTPVERIRLIGDDDEECAVGHPAFGEVFSILTNTTISEGNRVEVLTNGDGVYPRLWEDLESAESLITWHVFWFKPGQLADRLQEILIDRARAGVEVLFLYDYFGSMGVPDEYFGRLREAGVKVAAFRPPRWNTLYKIQQRMHVRAVVIDGAIGYTGGFAISDEWIGNGRQPGQWRDSSVRVEGTVVNQLQAAFVSNWAEAACELLLGDRVFPPGDGAPPGDVTAGVMYDAPGLGSTTAERFFALSVQGARERLYITNAYFVPDRYFREFLIDAVERGVDVRVLTPGANTDRLSTYHAARHGYEELLEGGVRIWHYRPTMVHAKTIVADGIWSAVGTINFDNRSMVLNDEVTLVMRDAGIAGLLERQFLEDLAHSDEVSLEELRARGIVDRLKERFFVTTSPFL